MSILQSTNVEIYPGLESHEFFMESLSLLYEELQLSSTEAAFPTEDFLTFILRTAYFGVITKRPSPPPKAEDYEDEDLDSPFDVDLDSFANTGVRFESQSAGTAPQSESSLWDTTEVSRDAVIPPPWNTESTPNPFCPLSYPRLGFIYLVSSQAPPHPPGSIGELTIGLIISEEYRAKGYAKEAVELVLEYAFTNLNTHRVQANILDTALKDRAIALFTRMRFGHEGTRRRSFYSQMEHQWKDVTCLAILETDWAMRSYFQKGAPTTLWDELLNRHMREREDLLRLEERGVGIGIPRTSSMETIRVQPVPTTMTDSEPSASDEEAVDSNLESSMIHAALEKGKRKISHGRRMIADTSNATNDTGRKIFLTTDASHDDDDSDVEGFMRIVKRRQTVSELADTANDSESEYYDATGGPIHFDPRDLWEEEYPGGLDNDPVPPSPSPSVSSSRSHSSSHHLESDVGEGNHWDLVDSSSVSSFDELSDV